MTVGIFFSDSFDLQKCNVGLFKIPNKKIRQKRKCIKMQFATNHTSIKCQLDILIEYQKVKSFSQLTSLFHNQSIKLLYENVKLAIYSVSTSQRQIINCQQLFLFVIYIFDLFTQINHTKPWYEKKTRQPSINGERNSSK